MINWFIWNTLRLSSLFCPTVFCPFVQFVLVYFRPLKFNKIHRKSAKCYFYQEQLNIMKRSESGLSLSLLISAHLIVIQCIGMFPFSTSCLLSYVSDWKLMQETHPLCIVVCINYYMKQKLRYWFEVNTKFPSTTLVAYMIVSTGLISQSHMDLSHPKMYSHSKCTLRATLSNFIIH